MITAVESSTTFRKDKFQTHNKCDDCKNQDICKYVNEYNNAIDTIKKVEVPDVMVVELSCKHYVSENAPVYRNRGSEGIKVPIWATKQGRFTDDSDVEEEK